MSNYFLKIDIISACSTLYTRDMGFNKNLHVVNVVNTNQEKNELYVNLNWCVKYKVQVCFRMKI